MTALQIIYTISCFVALSAGAFQLTKLLKKKNSDEFNLGTWLMWTGTQSVSTIYATSLHDTLLVIMSSAWVTFYALMSMLIIRYSTSRATLFKSIPPSQAPTPPASEQPLTDVTVEVAPEPAE